jgi:flagellum-specific ATP synthase
MQALKKEIEAIAALRRFGRVARIEGLLVEVTGAAGAISLGGQVRLTPHSGKQIPCEVVGFREGRALAMPLGVLDGMTLGARADFEGHAAAIFPCQGWLGRVLDAFAEPVDGKGPLPRGQIAYPLKAQPPPPQARARVGGKLDLGVRSTPSSPAARASAWAFSRAAASANRRCWPCWRATRMRTPSSSAWSANAGAR